jgi:hypothetical protein
MWPSSLQVTFQQQLVNQADKMSVRKPDQGQAFNAETDKK